MRRGPCWSGSSRGSCSARSPASSRKRLTGSRTGLLIATIVGIVGALLGGFLAKVLFHVHSLNAFFSLSTWLTATIGAVILVLIVRAVTGGRRGGTTV